MSKVTTCEALTALRKLRSFCREFSRSLLCAPFTPRSVSVTLVSLSQGANSWLGVDASGVDPGGEMPGFGAIVNDRRSLAAVWQLGTGAPEGSEIALPEEFDGGRAAVAETAPGRGCGHGAERYGKIATSAKITPASKAVPVMLSSGG